MGHKDRFMPPRLSGCCRFGQATLAGTHGNARDAPKPATASALRRREGSTDGGHQPRPVGVRINEDAEHASSA
jgi:hypothetical protein